MSDKLRVYHPTGTYMYRAGLATYAPVQLKQVRLLLKGHVCIINISFTFFTQVTTAWALMGQKAN